MLLSSLVFVPGGGATWYQTACVCPKVKDMGPFSASSE